MAAVAEICLSLLQRGNCFNLCNIAWKLCFVYKTNMALSKTKVVSSMLLFLEEDEKKLLKIEDEIEINIINLISSVIERNEGVRNFSYVKEVCLKYHFQDLLMIIMQCVFFHHQWLIVIGIFLSSKTKNSS